MLLMLVNLLVPHIVKIPEAAVNVQGIRPKNATKYLCNRSKTPPRSKRKVRKNHEGYRYPVPDALILTLPNQSAPLHYALCIEPSPGMSVPRQRVFSSF